jgi:hypothetical protein
MLSKLNQVSVMPMLDLQHAFTLGPTLAELSNAVQGRTAINRTELTQEERKQRAEKEAHHKPEDGRRKKAGVDNAKGIKSALVEPWVIHATRRRSKKQQTEYATPSGSDVQRLHRRNGRQVLGTIRQRFAGSWTAESTSRCETLRLRPLCLSGAVQQDFVESAKRTWLCSDVLVEIYHSL